MKHLYLICFFIILFQKAPAQWSYIGLGAHQCSDLTIYADTIYASTDDGIFKRWIYATDTNWLPAGMQGQHVVQTFVPSYSHFISVVEIGSTSTTQIYKSQNYGQSFNLMNPDTSDPNLHMFLDHMAHPEGNFDTLYFLNHHLKTFDGGNSWDTIHNNSLNDRFIKVNDDNHNELLIGGETWALSPYVQVSPDRGLNWNFRAMTNYFAGDNSVHDIAFFYSNIWYAAGEGVICWSSDGGNNWTQQINYWGGPPQFSLYFWDIEYANGYLFVTGSNTNAPDVPLIIIDYFGSFWIPIAFPPAVPGNPEIHSLTWYQTGVGYFIFLGGHGVYTYDFNPMDISNNESKKHFTIYPNPFESSFTLNTDFSTNEFPLKLELVNVLGETAFKIEVYSKTAVISPTLSPGIYLCRMKGRSGHFELGERIIKF